MNKSQGIQVLMLSLFSFLALFLLSHKKSLLIISSFLEIDKAIVSNWYQNLDDKLVKECVRFKINITWILVVMKRICF